MSKKTEQTLREKLYKQTKLYEEQKRLNSEQKKIIKEQDHVIKERDNTIGTLQSIVNTESDMWQTPLEGRKGKDSTLLHKREVIHSIIHDDESLRKTINLDIYQFEDIYQKFKKKSKRNKKLFREDSKPNRGNRCKLTRREILYLALLHKKEGTHQNPLGVLFSINQGTVSKHLTFADNILKEILPTGNAVNKRIKETKSRKEFEELVPDHTIIIDGTEVPCQRPTDKEEQKTRYSGKKKKHTHNTTIITNKDGLIIQTGRTYPGSTSDISMIRQDRIKLGQWSKSIYEKSHHAKKYKILGDKGYAGFSKDCPGADVMIPKKKSPKKEQTIQENTHNKIVSKKRIKIEHAIGGVKRWRIMNGPYDGTVEDFERDLEIATGLANFVFLWDKKRKRLKFGF